MPVSTTHPEYALARPRWRLVRDCLAGQDAVKRQGVAYLPATFAADDPLRYEQYIGRAFFMGVTGRTHAALLGMVFRKAATYTLPPQVEALIEDIDGSGQSLTQLSKTLVAELLSVGRYALLVDYPQADENLDMETERTLGLRPTIAAYPAESLINWRFEGIAGRRRLTLAVLAEQVPSEVDEYTHTTVTVYRVLRLRDGVYTQAIYNEQGRVLSEEYAPRMAGGATFDYIPLHIAGSTDNFPNPDIGPLVDMAHLNIAHYQSTAELKENEFFSAQGTLHLDVGDMDADAFKAANPNGVVIGRRAGIVTSGGGSATLLQGDSRQSDILATMAHEEQQMVAIGARLVQRGGSNETAEAARINASAEASTLDTLVNNASECIEAALEDFARFLGADPGVIEYRLNTDFWATGLSAQDLQAITAGTGKLYGAQDAIEMIRAGRIYIRDDRPTEDILADAASTMLDGEQI